ncbi:hypothetical protein [Kitasatospora sp. NPDC050467]|uniref:hypothetical protein n=1 Tax=unclassified Kitasatospora TaxID=2633591 RepID=UPI00324B1C67
MDAAFRPGRGDLGRCPAGFLAHVRVGVLEEGLDQRPGLRMVYGAEDVDGVREEFTCHRRHGWGQRFDKIQGQAVAVERLADRVQGGLADLGHGFGKEDVVSHRVPADRNAKTSIRCPRACGSQ